MDSTALKKRYFQLLLQHMQRYLRFSSHPTIRYYIIRRTQLVYSLLQKTTGVILLDVGCGEGLDVYNLARHYSYVIGIDLSVDALKRASRGNRPKNSFFIRGDAENLPLRNESICISLCLDVLEHLPEPRKALKELTRVSKDLIVIAVPLATNPPFTTLLTKLRWLKTTPFNIDTVAVEKGVKELPEHGHINEYTVERIRSEIERLKIHKIKKLILMNQFTIPFREKVLLRFPKLVQIFIQLDKIFSKLFPIGRWGSAVAVVQL